MKNNSKTFLIIFLSIFFSVISSFSCFAYAVQDPYQSVTASSSYPNSLIDLGRSDVFTRASYMASVKWTVLTQHKYVNPSNASKITVPNYVLNATVQSKVTGIPYCWGGFNGYASVGTKYTKKSFLSVVSGNYTAGNKNCSSDGYVDNTIGLDCSGYVSSAYGLTIKKSTGGLNNSNYGHSIGYNRLLYMDYLVKSGNHVVLFYNRYFIDGAEWYTIYDSAVDTEKVSSRAIKKSYYVNGEYVARTPWHTVDQSLHNTSSDPHRAIYANPTSHYWSCSDCQAMRYDTHIYESGSTICAECGAPVGGSW